MVSAMDAPMTLDTAIDKADQLVCNSADSVMRLVLVGARLNAAGKLNSCPDNRGTATGRRGALGRN